MSVSGRRDSEFASHFFMKRSGGVADVGRAVVDCTWIQAPWRTERDEVVPVNMKWKPEGRFFMP